MVHLLLVLINYTNYAYFHPTDIFFPSNILVFETAFGHS